MTPRPSKYDLNMAENYVRLAFQSASPDQLLARARVAEIRGDEFDSDLHQRERIQAFAKAILKLFEEAQ